MLVSDYGYGSATPAMLQAVRGRGRWTVPVALDSRYRLQEYAGLGLTAATPNEAELEAACHEQVGADTGRLQRLAQQMASRLGLGALVVTRGTRRHDGIRARTARRSRWPFTAATRRWTSPARGIPSLPC